jgi:hypothetical protein
MPKKPIILTPEQELELAQDMFFMVIDVSEEASNRVAPGDGVYFSEPVGDMERIPVQWMQKVDEKTKDLIKDEENEVDDDDMIAYDTVVKHVSRLLGVRKQMYKDEITT